MTAAFKYSGELHEIVCGACGIVFAVPSGWRDARRQDKATFYCPNGHPRAYVDSETDQLKKELEREKQRREMAEREAAMEAKRADRAAKNLARIQKRVKHGVCPCCKRTVKQLAQHMATKHPEFKTDGES